MWLHSSVGRASHRYLQRSQVRILLKPWFFSGFFLIAQTGKFTAMITLHSYLQPQYKYELFHINFTRSFGAFHMRMHKTELFKSVKNHWLKVTCISFKRLNNKLFIIIIMSSWIVASPTLWQVWHFGPHKLMGDGWKLKFLETLLELQCRPKLVTGITQM